MASTSDIRKGFCIEFKHDIFVVTDFLHVKPGKGPAFVRTTLKSVTSGKVIDETFPSGHKLEEVRVERRKFQYLYTDDMGLQFMNTEDFEQIAIAPAMVSNSKFLKDSMDVEMLFHSTKNIPLTVELPAFVVYEITYTESVVAGNTSTNASKYATIETGAEIKVPLFINTGDKVRVNTENGDYMERVKQ